MFKHAVLAVDDLDGDARFLVRLVCQQNAARNVADGVNVRVIGLLTLVDLHKPFFIKLNFGVFQTKIGAVRRSAHGHEHTVVKFGHLLAVVFHLNLDLFSGGGHFHDLRLETDFLEHLPRVGHDGPREVRVGAGEHIVERLDDRDFAAERGIDGAEFHADVAAAHNQQIFRNIGDFERLGRSHDERIAEVEHLGHRRDRADGENCLVILDELLPLLRLDAQGLRTFKITASLNHLHAAHFGKRGDTAAEFFQNGFLPRAELRQIHRRRRERDAAMFGFPGGGDLVRCIKQRL